MTPEAPYVYLPWDSAHFGVSIARLNAKQLTERTIDELQHWLPIAPVECLYLLAEHDPDTMKLAAQSDFRYVDSRVTLERSIAEAVPTSLSHIRRAEPSDIAELRRIAGESHHASRFYTDGNFARAACDELYRIWIEKSVHDPEDAVFVAAPNREPAGYVTCNLMEGAGVIGLLAVDSATRGCGFGRDLLSQAFAWMRSRGAVSAKVVTQGANVPSLRLYEKSGFATSSVELWYHRWESRPK